MSSQVNYKSAQGFSLIELLVVLLITSMLLAILVSALKKVKEKAQETICQSNLGQIGLTIHMYLNNNNNKSYNYRGGANDFHWVDSSGKYLDPNDVDAYWGVAYKDYIYNSKIFGCPSFQRVSKLIYPVDPILIRDSAYGLNHFFCGLNTNRISSPMHFIITHDHVEPKLEHGSDDKFHNDGVGTLNLKHFREGGVYENFYRGIFRHSILYSEPFRTGGNANVLWLDNHVSSLHETMGDDVPEFWYSGK